MTRKEYPHCDKCGDEINPHVYDDCEKYYISNGSILCKACFIKEETEFLETNTDDYAALVGAGVVEVE